MTFQFNFVGIAQPWIFLLTKLFGDFPFLGKGSSEGKERVSSIHRFTPFFVEKTRVRFHPLERAKEIEEKRGTVAASFSFLLLLLCTQFPHRFRPSAHKREGGRERRKGGDWTCRHVNSPPSFLPFRAESAYASHRKRDGEWGGKAGGEGPGRNVESSIRHQFFGIPSTCMYRPQIACPIALEAE